jgi:potassium channel subfamily T protein 1
LYSLFLSRSYGCEEENPSAKFDYLVALNMTEERFRDNPIINWDAIVWIKRPIYMWIFQILLAIVSLSESILLAYLGYKVSLS